MSDLMKVGADFGGLGTFKPLTAGISGAQRVSDAHGRFLQAALENRLFSGGMGLTSINNATFTSATLGATCTPIAGVYNPLGSGKQLSILGAGLNGAVTAATATGPGGFVWAAGVTTTGLTLGGAPFSRLSLLAAGSVAKNMAGLALTGLTPNLSIWGASALMFGNLKNISSVETAVGQNIGVGGVTWENFDGSVIVPPGGVLALLATTTPVAHSAASILLWEELPILTQA